MQTTPPITTSNIIDIITALGVIITFIVAIRKTPHEVLGMDASTAQIFQEIAEKAAQDELKKNMEIKQLKLKIGYLEKRVELLKEQLVKEQSKPFELELKIGVLEKRIEVLKEQLIKAGIPPVEFKENGV